MKKSVSGNKYATPLAIAAIAMVLAVIFLFVPMVTATPEAEAKFIEDGHTELTDVSLYSFRMIFFYQTTSDMFSYGLVLAVVLSIVACILALYKKWLAAIICEAPVLGIIVYESYLLLATCLNGKYVPGIAVYAYPVIIAAVIVGLVWFAIAVPGKAKKEKKIKKK